MRTNEFHIHPIGIVHSPFHQAKGTPIQPAFAKGVMGSVEIFAEYRDGLKDLEGFERIWLLFWCDQARQPHLQIKPYLDEHLRGLFATRAPSRPNPVGMSCVKLLSIENGILQIEELDMLDGTPVLDIKPYVPKFDSFAVTRYGWLQDKEKGNATADNRFFKNQEREI
ncbi:MAG: tRNA (N6-threonylcarbamoyladenosine(37)-N6)-methyltransferase TrmO [Sedimentisphaerales bacterium]|nr:tRNA (N6-threonylcarbamoyladenosine(37)-N6)-methyltransferase TrmO [Sedimentisphaerales bacterium]